MINISQECIDKRICIHDPITRMETKFVVVKDNNSILLMVSSQVVHIDAFCVS